MLTALLILSADAQPPEDRVAQVPGYPSDYKPATWAGFLSTKANTKKLFYIFTESEGQKDKDPVTLWLNGGPGCSSLLGWMQEVGPFYLEDGVDYKQGDKLTRNEFAWTKASNMLFIESPAGVGFSVNNQSDKRLNDSVTADDLLEALRSFRSKFPALKDRSFWISGQSYAGKYIPDLAQRIDIYNQQNPNDKINLQGMLIGNGVMSFKNKSMTLSSAKFVLDHELLSQSLDKDYEKCANPASIGCDEFLVKYSALTNGINPYNIYGYCFDNKTKLSLSSQADQLAFHTNTSYGAPCAYFDGIYHYFNLNKAAFHASNIKVWEGPCNDAVSQKYSVSEQGSIDELRYLLFRNKYRIVLYNGDWDAVVPYVDTLKNLPSLYVNPVGNYEPWFVLGQHAGFKQDYTMNLTFATVKGASHQVPQARRQAALALFRQTIS